MPKITNQEVEKIAKLARIKLSPNEITKYASQLGDILNYVNQLSEVDTKNTEPTSQITGLVNIMRQDKVKIFKDSQSLIKLAPESKDGQVKVKSIL